MIRAVRLPPWPAAGAVGRLATSTPHLPGMWEAFWDDRRAIRLKVLLLLLTLAVAALLEAPL